MGGCTERKKNDQWKVIWVLEAHSSSAPHLFSQGNSKHDHTFTKDGWTIDGLSGNES